MVVEATQLPGSVEVGKNSWSLASVLWVLFVAQLEAKWLCFTGADPQYPCNCSLQTTIQQSPDGRGRDRPAALLLQ